MIETNFYCEENERLSNREFSEIVPLLSLHDLLSTEYRVDNKWYRLIQLRDPSKQLYQCSVCCVVQCGVKNLFLHVDGKKHKLKMTSIKQLYHPKYTHEQYTIEENLVNSKNSTLPTEVNVKYHPGTKREIYSNSSPSKNLKNASLNTCNNSGLISAKINTGTNDNSVNKSEVISIYTSTNKAEITQSGILQQKIRTSLLEGEHCRNNSKEDDDLSTSVLISESKEKYTGVGWGKSNCMTEEFDRNDADEPPPKKKKVRSPATLNKLIKETYPDEGKPQYQTNITIIPTKMKRNEDTCIETENSCNNKQIFTSKRFSCNSIDDDVHGLIGVEYVVKILRTHNSLPKYECGLCEVLNDGIGMQNHLLGYNHRLKFCEKHFPTAVRQYRQYIRNIKSNIVYKVMTPILNKLAIAIERHHGRDLPYECLENEFSANRHEILSKVFSCRHASEQYGPTFTHIIDSKEVDKLISEVDKYQAPSVFPHIIEFDLHANITSFQTQKTSRKQKSGSDIFTAPKAKICNSSLQRYSNEIVPSVQGLANETHKFMVTNFLENSWKQSSPQYLLQAISPSCERILRGKLLSPLRENDVWQAYRHLVDQKIVDLNKVFLIYRSDPETHPAYEKEWQAFWKRRKNELMDAGLDHRAYNYQPDWVRFFKIRIEELYNQAVENIKIDARERLYLPMTNENSLNEKYHVKAKDDEKALLGVELYEFIETPKVISVLRLLTALENYLGSLGPKVVDLLSKAIQVEKNNPSQLDTIILTQENCNILETVIEKFKGLIIADIFDDNNHNALRKAIVEVDSLLSETTQRTRIRRSMLNFEKTLEQKHATSKDKQLLTNIQAQVDKKEFALNLASLLAAQGKTEINPEQLQKIISVYMLIEKKKQEALITSKSDTITYLGQSNMCNLPSKNYSKFFESKSSPTRMDSKLLMCDAKKRIDKFQVNFGNMLRCNSSESSTTFCSSKYSNMKRNVVLSNNYQQYMDNGVNNKIQRSRPNGDSKTNILNSAALQNKRKCNWQ